MVLVPGYPDPELSDGKQQRDIISTWKILNINSNQEMTIGGLGMPVCKVKLFYLS